MIPTLNEVRRNIINELMGFVKSKGTMDMEDGHYEIPIYEGEDGISIKDNTEDVYNIMVVDASMGRGVVLTRLVIETDADWYYADDLYTDDLDDILHRLKSMTEVDFRRCRNWFEDYKEEVS